MTPSLPRRCSTTELRRQKHSGVYPTAKQLQAPTADRRTSCRRLPRRHRRDAVGLRRAGRKPKRASRRARCIKRLIRNRQRMGDPEFRAMGVRAWTGVVDAQRDTKGRIPTERSFISSLAGAVAARFLWVIRDHWGADGRSRQRRQFLVKWRVCWLGPIGGPKERRQTGDGARNRAKHESVGYSAANLL